MTFNFTDILDINGHILEVDYNIADGQHEDFEVYHVIIRRNKKKRRVINKKLYAKYEDDIKTQMNKIIEEQIRDNKNEGDIYHYEMNRRD